MKMFKKTLSVLLAVMMLMGCVSVISLAADGDTIEVSLRVEGINNCFYNNVVTVPAGSTALDVIKAADEADANLDVTVVQGAWGPYITTVNGEIAGTKTESHSDGWNYRVNNLAPNVGVGAYNVSAKDEIILYYADPMGVGMQFPEANLDDITSGIISFTSKDTTYDENYNPVVSVNPVKDYVLTWGYNGTTVEIRPDENGVCRIPHKYLQWGTHSVQIERYDEATGLPTVLRYADNYTVEPYNPNTMGDYIVHMVAYIFEMIQDALGSIVA